MIRANTKEGQGQMRSNKKLLFGFSAAAFLLLIASTAYACTIFMGSFSVTGDAAPGTVTVHGKDGGMNQDVNSGIARASRKGGSFTISTGVSAANGKVLPNNEYQIRYFNSMPLLPGYVGTGTSRQWNQDCMSEPIGTKIGSTTVLGGVVTGQKKFDFNNIVSLNANPPGIRESAVCITDSSALYGNQAPITII